MERQVIRCLNELEIPHDSLIVNLIIFYKGWNSLLTAVMKEKYLGCQVQSILNAQTSSNIWSYNKLIS